MIFQLETSEVPDGTVLLFGVRYVGQTSPKIFIYAALLAGGRWYMTGSGRVPQDAGWGVVQRWLDDERREVVWVRRVTATDLLWTRNPDHPELHVVARGEGVLNLVPGEQ